MIFLEKIKANYFLLVTEHKDIPDIAISCIVTELASCHIVSSMLRRLLLKCDGTRASKHTPSFSKTDESI